MTAPAAAPATSTPLLSVRDLTKAFNQNVALNAFDLDLPAGEVHALLGHNGSGKSTFIKILAGFYTPDTGEVSVEGKQLRFGDPTSSSGVGLSFVHQTLGLVPSLSVLENLHLGQPYGVNRVQKINWRAERARARVALGEFGLSVNPSLAVRDLTTVERVEVAIVRALSAGPSIRVLVLDEPTAALTDREVQRLFETVRRVAGSGVAVIYVSHRLEEVPLIADAVTILSDGNVIARGPAQRFSHRQLVSLITTGAASSEAGEEDEPVRAARGPDQAVDEEPREVIFSLRDLTGSVLEDFALEGREGEIVGVVGLLGSGVEELADILGGRRPLVSGTMEIDGKEVPIGAMATLGARGFHVVIGDKSDRVAFDLDAGENAVMSVVPSFFRAGVLRRGRMRAAAVKTLEDFHVRPPEPALRAGSLSGGNQQKLAIGRVLQAEPQVLVLEEPFQGVDVQGREELSAILRDASRTRLVLVIDSDIEEVVSLCDRVLVLNEGQIVLEARSGKSNKADLLDAAYGQAEGVR